MKEVPKMKRQTAADIVIGAPKNKFYYNTKRDTSTMLRGIAYAALEPHNTDQLDKEADEIRYYNNIVNSIGMEFEGTNEDHYEDGIFPDWFNADYRLRVNEYINNFTPLDSVLVRYFHREVLYHGNFYLGTGRVGFDFVEVAYAGAGGTRVKTNSEQIPNPYKFQNKALVVGVSERIAEKGIIKRGDIIVINPPSAYTPVAANKDLIEFKGWFKLPGAPNMDCEKNRRSPDYGWGLVSQAAVQGLYL